MGTKSVMVFTMSSQEHLWLLSEECILLDENVASEDGSEDADGEVILNTYGRGKLLSAIALPRMPYTCLNVHRPPLETHEVQIQEVMPGSQPSQGRGRARLIQNRLEKISKEKLNFRVPNSLKTFHNDLEKPGLPPRVPVVPVTLPAPPDYLLHNYEDYQESFSSEKSSSSSLSLLDFPVLVSPKKKKQNMVNIDSVSSQGKKKANKLSLNSLTDSILTSSKSNKTSKINEVNTDSYINDDIQTSDELLVLDDDIDTALEEQLSSLDDMETSDVCGGMATSKDTDVDYDLTSSQQDTLVCESNNMNMDWTLAGENIIQCDGLPRKCDISVLEEIIASFGKIIDSQTIVVGNSSSVRFKLGNSDSCEWAISCLHDSDCVYPDSNRVLECYRVDIQ